MPSSSDPRRAALDILRAVRAGAPFDHALAGSVANLSTTDRRLTHEIAAGVLRERRTLDRWIRGVLSQPSKTLQHDLSDILRIGAYQLAHLDRVPSYAAVQSAVDLAKTSCGARTAPLVNAVLRRLSREPSGWTGPADGSWTLAERYSHPDWLVERWIDRYGVEQTEALLAFNNRRPPTVIQPLRWSLARLADALAAADVPADPAPGGRGLIVATGNVADLPGYADGAFIVQDPSQRELIELVDWDPVEPIWDVCAAPGGKAVTLGAKGTVFATDRSRRRLQRLVVNAARCRARVTAVCADGRYPPWPDDRFDTVVLDAPCSATGAIARHPDARWRLTPQRIREAARYQEELLDASARTVKPGGLLVYITCSLEPEENEQQIDRFLARHRTFRRAGHDVHLLPPGSGSGGGFGARLRRAA